MQISGPLQDKCRNEVLGARVVLYMAAKKWDMAATVASHLVKVQPENAGWWINLAYSVRRSEGIEKAEAILVAHNARSDCGGLESSRSRRPTH